MELFEIGTARDALARLVAYLDLPRRQNHQDRLSSFFNPSLDYISTIIVCVFRFDSADYHGGEVLRFQPNLIKIRDHFRTYETEQLDRKHRPLLE